MYICIYMNIHQRPKCMPQVYMCICIYAYMYIHKCVDIHQRPRCMPKRHIICMYVHIYIYRCCMCKCVYINICT